MNKSILVILGVAAVGLTAGALMLDRSETPTRASAPVTEDVVGNIASRINDVARIEMRNADGEVTLLKNAEQAWTIEQSGGYRANADQVRQLLFGIGGMEVSQRLTSRQDLLPELGLGEPGTAGTRSTLVALKDESGSEIASFVFGNTKMGPMPGSGQSVYIRRANETQAWEVRSSASPSTTVASWRPREIINVPTGRVRRMEVEIGDELAYNMERPASPEDSFQIESARENWKVRETVSGDRSVAGFLQSMTLNDVKPTMGFFDGLTDESRLLTQTFDGLEVETLIRKEGEKVFATLAARYNQSLRDVLDANAEELITEGSPLKTADDVQAEVAEINRLTAGWAYELPTWKFSGIERSSRTTILEEIKEDLTAAQILISWEGAPQSRVTGRTQEEARELAESLRIRLEEEDYNIFGDLAREYSDDADTAEEGGELGMIAEGDMTPEFTDALSVLEAGEISGVIETPFGYAIIKKGTAP